MVAFLHFFTFNGLIVARLWQPVPWHHCKVGRGRSVVAHWSPPRRVLSKYIYAFWRGQGHLSKQPLHAADTTTRDQGVLPKWVELHAPRHTDADCVCTSTHARPWHNRSCLAYSFAQRPQPTIPPGGWTPWDSHISLPPVCMECMSPKEALQ